MRSTSNEEIEGHDHLMKANQDLHADILKYPNDIEGNIEVSSQPDQINMNPLGSISTSTGKNLLTTYFFTNLTLMNQHHQKYQTLP